MSMVVKASKRPVILSAASILGFLSALALFGLGSSNPYTSERLLSDLNRPESPVNPGRFNHSQKQVLGPSAPPMCGKEPSTLTKVDAAAPFTVLVPEHPLANRSNLEGTVLCTPEELLLYFESGVRVLMERGGIAGEPSVLWAAMAAEDPASASVGIVRGRSALLVQPNEKTNPTTPGGVEFVEHDVFVAVSGDGTIPLADLIDVAESLKAT